MDDRNRPRSGGVLFEDCIDVQVTDNQFVNIDDPIVARRTKNITAVRNSFLDARSDRDAEMIAQAVTLLDRLVKEKGRSADQSTATEAAEQSGLARWFADKGVEVGALSLQLLEFYRANFGS